MDNNNIVYVTIGVPMLFYVGQAFQYAISQGKYGLALAFASYALANIGFILDSKGF